MSEYEIHGTHDDAYVITRVGADRIEGVFYPEPGMPGWWRGHCRRYGVKEVYVPGNPGPLDIAERFV